MRGFVYKEAMKGIQERGHNETKIMNNIVPEWIKLPIKEFT